MGILTKKISGSILRKSLGTRREELRLFHEMKISEEVPHCSYQSHSNAAIEPRKGFLTAFFEFGIELAEFLVIVFPKLPGSHRYQVKRGVSNRSD